MLQNSTPAVAPPPALSNGPVRASQICNRVAAVVALASGVSRSAITGPTRGSPRAARARQIAMYLAHVGFALSLARIGRAFGRDRTTVAHACRLVEDGRDDSVFDDDLAMLEQVCRFVISGPEIARPAPCRKRGGGQ